MVNSKKGFTLIELLIVIAIIGILSAIGLVSLNGAREKARDVQARSDLSTFRAALGLYYDDHGDAYPGVLAVGGIDSSAVSDGTGYTPGSVWDLSAPVGASPMITEYIATIKTPSTTSKYVYAASNSVAGVNSKAGAYVVGYRFEGNGGTTYYSINNTGKSFDMKDGHTAAPTCVTDASATNRNGSCSG